MCMSVPQMAVLAISISTSLGPTFGSGISLSQMPGAACSLTSAFMLWPLWGRCRRLSMDHSQLTADLRERLQRARQLLTGEGGRHLRADARLALGHHRVGEADDVHPACEQGIGHAAGECSIPEHHWNDRVLAGP